MKKILYTTSLFISAFFFHAPLHAQCTSFPVVDLGPDTIVCDTSLTLDAGNPGMLYNWSTSDSSQQVAVNTGGVYSVIVTDSLGCSGYDTVNVSFNTPSSAGIISLIGGDTILCGNEYTIYYMTAHTGYVLWWAIDSTNGNWVPFGSGDTLDYDYAPNGITGVYTFVATVTNGSCPADTSNFLNIALYSSPEVDLGPDDTICAPGTQLFTGYWGEQTIWNTGDTTSSIPVYATGTFICTVTFQSGCSDSDTIYWAVLPYPQVSWSCPVDTMCYTDAPLLLTPGIPPGGAFVGMTVANGYFTPSNVGSNFVTYTWPDTVTGCVGGAGDYIWVDACIGIQEPEQVQQELFPNPAADFVTIYCFSSESLIEIIDAQGRVVKSVENADGEGEVQIDIHALSEGVYMIRTTGADGVRYSRFVKQSVSR